MCRVCLRPSYCVQVTLVRSVGDDLQASLDTAEAERGNLEDQLAAAQVGCLSLPVSDLTPAVK